jgi:hypothetical protein
VKAIATSDEIAGKGHVLSIHAKANGRMPSIEIVNTYVLDFEEDLSIGSQAGVDQVLNDFRLRIDRDSLARQSFEIDSVPGTIEPQLDSVVDQTLALHPLPDASAREQINRILL